ncbi:PREDICTED: uncharacterized protein LOC109190320 [Ipomoea nil]|uniref:uncharacterized protein LOC109190320 n=1 Tax=Ipomoea nil TaxID=35883 RepID=UPI000901745F|nr:PREDICTED: uncharacterized protein LOC109190320 [Ipomoea nil]
MVLNQPNAVPSDLKTEKPWPSLRLLSQLTTWNTLRSKDREASAFAETPQSTHPLERAGQKIAHQAQPSGQGQLFHHLNAPTRVTGSRYQAQQAILLARDILREHILHLVSMWDVVRGLVWLSWGKNGADNYRVLMVFAVYHIVHQNLAAQRSYLHRWVKLAIEEDVEREEASLREDLYSSDIKFAEYYNVWTSFPYPCSLLSELSSSSSLD